MTLNKDGSVGKYSIKNVATREQFDLLDQFVMKKLKQAGGEILAGQISPAPLQTADINGCEWCDFKDICGFDERIPGYKKNKSDIAGDVDTLWNLMEE